MKALVAQELSGPSGLAYTEVDDPAGDGMVVVDVGAAGVCFPDLLLIRGEYQLKLDPPFTPGMEVAGTVRSAPEGSGFTPGQRVSAFTMLGGYAERVAVPPDNVVASPDDVDDASAVCLLGNYYTMYFALERRGALRPGETVLVLGSGGGVGTAAIQIAKALGAKVIAMVHRASAVEYVESLGADVVLPLTDGWAQAVRDADRWPRRRPGGGPDRRGRVRRRDPGAGNRGTAAGARLRGGWHPDRQGEPAAAAQRQRGRRRVRRVREPHARVPSRCSGWGWAG